MYSDRLNSLSNRTIMYFVLTRINSKLFKEDLKFCFFLNIHAAKALGYLQRNQREHKTRALYR